MGFATTNDSRFIWDSYKTFGGKPDFCEVHFDEVASVSTAVQVYIKDFVNLAGHNITIVRNVILHIYANVRHIVRFLHINQVHIFKNTLAR